MAQDTRWPFIPFLALRGVQLLFSVITLGLTAYIVSLWSVWWAALGLTTALLTMIYVVINFVLFFMGLLLPLPIVIVDAVLFLFFLISMAGTADSGFLSSDCTYEVGYIYTYATYTSTPCNVTKGAFAIELLSMFLFIGSTVLASITLHKNRKDLSGRKYNEGLPPVSSATAGGVQMQLQPPAATYQQQGTEEQKVDYYEQGPPAQFVSPISSPGPTENLQQQTTGYSTVSSQQQATGYSTVSSQNQQYQQSTPQQYQEMSGYQGQRPELSG